MNQRIALVAGLSLSLIAAPWASRAGDTPEISPAPTPAASPAPSATKGAKNHDVNRFLDNHPKLKAKALAKFDTNHNGMLDGDEITAFRQWRKEHREEIKRKRSEKPQPEAGTPSPSPSPAAQ